MSVPGVSDSEMSVASSGPPLSGTPLSASPLPSSPTTKRRNQDRPPLQASASLTRTPCRQNRLSPILRPCSVILHKLASKETERGQAKQPSAAMSYAEVISEMSQ